MEEMSLCTEVGNDRGKTRWDRVEKQALVHGQSG